MKTEIKICHANEFCEKRWRVVDSFDAIYPVDYLGSITPQIEEYLSSPNFELQDGLVVRCEAKNEIPCTLVYFNDEFLDVGAYSEITRDYYVWRNQGHYSYALDGISWPDAWCYCDDPYTIMETLSIFAPFNKLVALCVVCARTAHRMSLTYEERHGNYDIYVRRPLSEAMKWANGKSQIKMPGFNERTDPGILILFEMIINKDASKIRSFMPLMVGNHGHGYDKNITDAIRKAYPLHDVLIDMLSK